MVTEACLCVQSFKHWRCYLLVALSKKIMLLSAIVMHIIIKDGRHFGTKGLIDNLQILHHKAQNLLIHFPSSCVKENPFFVWAAMQVSWPNFQLYNIKIRVIDTFRKIHPFYFYRSSSIRLGKQISLSTHESTWAKLDMVYVRFNLSTVSVSG
jgi:hypothetical protein